LEESNEAKEYDTGLKFCDEVIPVVIHDKTTNLDDKNQAIISLQNEEFIQPSTSNTSCLQCWSCDDMVAAPEEQSDGRYDESLNAEDHDLSGEIIDEKSE
jgi:hypothetical protein